MKPLQFSNLVVGKDRSIEVWYRSLSSAVERIKNKEVLVGCRLSAVVTGIAREQNQDKTKDRRDMRARGCPTQPNSGEKFAENLKAQRWMIDHFLDGVVVGER